MGILSRLMFWKKREDKITERDFPEGFEQSNDEETSPRPFRLPAGILLTGHEGCRSRRSAVPKTEG